MNANEVIANRAIQLAPRRTRREGAELSRRGHGRADAPSRRDPVDSRPADLGLGCAARPGG
jgi:hypothetical protein